MLLSKLNFRVWDYKNDCPVEEPCLKRTEFHGILLQNIQNKQYDTKDFAFELSTGYFDNRGLEIYDQDYIFQLIEINGKKEIISGFAVHFDGIKFILIHLNKDLDKIEFDEFIRSIKNGVYEYFVFNNSHKLLIEDAVEIVENFYKKDLNLFLNPCKCENNK